MAWERYRIWTDAGIRWSWPLSTYGASSSYLNAAAVWRLEWRLAWASFVRIWSATKSSAHLVPPIWEMIILKHEWSMSGLKFGSLYSMYIYLSYNAATTFGRSSEDVRKHVWKQMEGPISPCASPLRSSVSLFWTPPSLSLWVGHMRTRPSFHESWWGVGRDWTNHQRGVCR